MTSPAGRALVAAFVITLAGCDGLLPAGPLGEAPDLCGFPPGTELAFAGLSSLQRLGIPVEHDAVGDFYVTAEPVPIPDPNTEPWRMYCVVRDGALVEFGPVPDDWTPP